MAVFWVVASCSLVYKFTDVSEVLAASIIRAMMDVPLKRRFTSKNLKSYLTEIYDQLQNILGCRLYLNKYKEESYMSSLVSVV
jgi:hypothetical protein